MELRSVDAMPLPMNSLAFFAESIVLLAIPATAYPLFFRRYPIAVPTTPAPIIATLSIIYINLTAEIQVIKIKVRHDKKAFRRLINALLTLFDMHLSKAQIRLKVPSGEYGLSFVAFKRFFIMSDFHCMQLIGIIQTAVYFAAALSGRFFSGPVPVSSFIAVSYLPGLWFFDQSFTSIIFLRSSSLPSSFILS